MRTKLAHFTQKAREEPRERLYSLMGLLWDPWRWKAPRGWRIAKEKASRKIDLIVALSMACVSARIAVVLEPIGAARRILKR